MKISRLIPKQTLAVAPRVLGMIVVCIFFGLNTQGVSAQEPLATEPQFAQPQPAEPFANELQPTELQPAQPQPDQTQPPADQPVPTPATDTAERSNTPDAESGKVRFSFNGASWRDVITWMADEADLALHVSEIPPGSFTYTDPNAFTHDDAIDRINLFLLPQGFTLVRNGQLLTVINLNDPRSMNQLDAMADMIPAQDLDKRNTHEVVKCIFRLGEIDAEDAVLELSALNLMTTPAVLSRTNQLIITDTVAKLKTAKAILDAFEPSTLDNGTVVKNFALQHVDAEDILLVARPHMGLATGEMIGIDVSLSADLQGKNIFITGVEDKVKLLENLVTALDRPDKQLSTQNGENVLQAHAVSGGNVETVYNVLLTILAGKSVRLSMDKEAGTVVALATPETQAEIAQTVLELQATDAEFEVIPLKTVDPYFVISLLEEMLDLPDALDDPDDIDPDAPKIDADPGNMRLFVRAKRDKIEQIRKIVEGLDSAAVTPAGDDTLLLPVRGEQALNLLETSARFWRGENPVLLFQTNLQTAPRITERVVGSENPTDTMSRLTAARQPADAKLLTTKVTGGAPAIRCQLTPRGLILQCEDATALAKFEEHFRMLSGPVDSTPSPPVIFYLTHTKADDALRMLAELLDGGEAASEVEGGTLVNGYVSSSSYSGFLGSIISSRDGTMSMIFDSVTVVSDSRLNRLIAQGSTDDLAKIEEYLNIIDKDSSLTSIETYGTSHVIELTNTRASEVAAVIREAYAGRVTASTTGAAPKGASPGGSEGAAAVAAQREAAAAKAAEAEKQAASKKGDAKKSAAQPARDLEPKMTIAVHEPSNSLIITAPRQLFAEVEQLAMAIDRRSETEVQVLTPSSGALMDPLLQQALGIEPSATSRSSSDRDRSRNSSRSDR
ncbi:secretin N-terminal domain-containing protein [Stieleria varia]|uniref:Bacterial type II/III secretion system short domain protein n=1 Tax=Stieleria varia TaxID=2528005 RepID=A0A5C6B750_9BACT|nr:secretin N-terminal domain-containing protein [Stieleria varia]TWU07863.1 Bacterial type II/III secretion system short domain protein [Stieleria varia]